MEPGDQQAVVYLRKPRFMRGIVAVFDVLGFKSFCENNTDQKVADEVLSCIDLAPEAMEGLLSRALAKTDEARVHVAEMVSKIQWLVFSDTIVAALPDAENSSKALLTTYLGGCALFNRIMFERGLPVRGAMHLGEFVMGNRCIAGKVIVEALQQVHLLEAACTVVHNDVWACLQDKLNPAETIDSMLLGMLPRCSVPCKGGAKTLTTLNWFNVSIGTASDLEDPYRFVMTQFLAHGKQLDAAAYAKARNTADIMNAWLAPRKKREESPKTLPNS